MHTIIYTFHHSRYIIGFGSEYMGALSDLAGF